MEADRRSNVLENTGRVLGFPSNCHDACNKFLSSFQQCHGILVALKIINMVPHPVCILSFLCFMPSPPRQEIFSDYANYAIFHRLGYSVGPESL